MIINVRINNNAINDCHCSKTLIKHSINFLNSVTGRACTYCTGQNINNPDLKQFFAHGMQHLFLAQ